MMLNMDGESLRSNPATQVIPLILLSRGKTEIVSLYIYQTVTTQSPNRYKAYAPTQGTLLRLSK